MKKIRKGDKVMVLTGRDKGKQGTVLRVLEDSRVLVESVNMIKRHTKPNPRAAVTGGIVQREAPIHVSNVKVISTDSGEPSRVGFKLLEDGRKVRFAKRDGAILDQ